MILKAKERGNAPQLARYLMAMRGNDHFGLHDVRGFISDDLVEAFGEAGSIARGTRWEKHLFSMSFKPCPSLCAQAAPTLFLKDFSPLCVTC